MTLYRTEINVFPQELKQRLRSESSSTSSGSGVVHDSTGSDDLAWEDRVRPLRDIVTGGKYPCLIKIKNGNVGKYMRKLGTGSVDPDNRNGFDEVLQVLELRRHKMVVTTKLQWERRTGEYSPTDKHVDINVAQKGWFEVLPENGQPVEYFDTINAIVGLRPKRFLVRTSTVGYELSTENGVSTWIPHEIRPGAVLTTGIIHMDQKKSKKRTLFKRLFSSAKGGKKDQELKYLQCFDSENCEIMVPLIMTGVFSPVGDPSSPSVDAVYTLHDLISAFNLPIKAQLVHSDTQSNTGVPSGVLLLERLKDSEAVLVGKHPYVEGETATFEIPLHEEIHVVKERRRKTKRPSLVTNEVVHEVKNNEPQPEPVAENCQVDLPIRVKETKKSTGSTILDKLSVRSKSRKERASLKALQEQGIFSSRMSKCELSFEDFYKNGEKSEEKDTSSSDPNNDESDTGVNVKTKAELDLENGYTVTSKQRGALLERDLPPIPNKTRSPVQRGHYDKENDYEELPVAPRPPKYYDDKSEDHQHDDGYMTPARFKELNGEISRQTSEDYDNVVKRKPPTAPKDYARLKYARARKARSEYATGQSMDTTDSNIVDQYFDYALGNNDVTGESPYTRRRQLPPQPSYGGNTNSSREDSRRFMDDSIIEAKSLSGFAKLKSRSQKNLAMETNATIRSHNVRKMRAAMDVFNSNEFHDSMRDIRNPFPNGNMDGPIEPMYGRVVDDERIKSYVYGQQSPYGRVNGQHYVESEPGYRKYHRSSSTAALSDSFPKHGDDSAISMCSRGEYGGTLHGESEYSYSEYSEWHDDGWIPPDDISNLSVLEVSKSLRYIGMKDRVVIRFAREQIDGNMLGTLDLKLLKEGFPELNALDIKKILDFVGGWRPKK